MRYFSTFSGIGGFELGIQRAFYNKYAHHSAETESSELDENLRQMRQRQTVPEMSRDTRRFGTADKFGSLLHTGDESAPLCVGYSEIDRYASSVYEHNFKGVKNYGDITKINADELPDFDCLVGGFPCQAFSIAGKRHGFEDTRGTLFFDLARILQAKRPRLFVFENVKGLLNHDSGNTFKTIIAAIDELGYDCQWQVLNSKNHGVPQNRERVIIVGHLRGTARPQVFPIIGTNSQDIIVSGILDTETWRKRYEQIRRFHSPDGISPTIPTGTGGGVMTKIGVRAVLTPDRTEKRQNGRRIKEDGEPSFTLTAQDKHGILVDHGATRKTENSTAIDANYYKGFDNHGQRTGISDGLRIRRLTPLECERLQGFPDNWTAMSMGGGVSDSQRYKMCGNAVTTNVICDVFERIFT